MLTSITRLIQDFDFREAFYDIDEERVPCPFTTFLEVYNHPFLAGLAPADRLVFPYFDARAKRAVAAFSVSLDGWSSAFSLAGKEKNGEGQFLVNKGRNFLPGLLKIDDRILAENAEADRI